MQRSWSLSMTRITQPIAAVAALCLLSATFATSAHAGAIEAITLSADYADFGKHAPKQDYAGFLSARLAVPLPFGLRPALGIGGFGARKFYGYGGLERPILFRNFALTPALGVGYYDGWGNKADLGYRLEFRESVSLTYRFTPEVSAGVQAAHMSNANLGDRNPGVNLFGVVVRREF